jgi:hypothetical protein
MKASDGIRDPDSEPGWESVEAQVRRLSLADVLRQHRARTLGLLAPAAALAVVVILAGTAILSHVLLAPASPSGPARYPDGIPMTWNGQPVQRGSAAIAKAEDSTDATPFYIGLWASNSQAFTSCGGSQEAGELDGFCTHMYNIGDQSGLASPALGDALRFDASDIVPGPVIVRVHTHDTAANECVASHRTACESIMVGDAIVWNGDEQTSPRPISTADVERVFGVRASRDTWTMCTTQLPGVAVYALYQSSDDMVAVFPSVQALQAVAPKAAAQGLSDSLPVGYPSNYGGPCIYASYGIPSTVRWLARGNVLVAVTYSTGLGPDTNPQIAEIEAKLQSLLQR